MRSRIGQGALAAVALAVTSVAFAGGLPATGGMGAKIYYTGGDVSVAVLPASAGYTSELNLYRSASPSQKRAKIATNREAGRVVSIPAAKLLSYGIKPGDELVFGIFVTNTNKTYFMGEGTRNPDGIAHAKVTINNPTTATVGFEDLFGGGDRDYNDNIFKFSGAISGKPTPPAPANRPPDCSKAKPSVSELWPPNHKMVPVSILGVTDPENDAVTIRILSVKQDEPVKGPGSGNTSPDAEINGSRVKLRAEREGGGNSRVYNITFTARDSKGATSPPTTVSVAVPHHRGAETPPKGPVTHDSTRR